MGRQSTQQHFIAERSRALAVVYLTRREDLIVTEETAKVGVDLWVTLNREGQEGHRKFGVEVRGGWAAITPGQANRALQASLQQVLRYRPFPFPVVLFYFTMEDERELVYVGRGAGRLVQGAASRSSSTARPSCRPLDTEAIDEIVEAVDRWYDAFFARAIRQASATMRNGSSAG